MADTTQATTPPTPGGRWAAAAAWLSDRANPLLVRHVRQELRNRRFFAVFTLLLTVSCLASIVVLSIADSRSSNVGMGLVAILGAALAFALWVAQPLGAFRALATERDDDTWDLIDLTGMRPAKLLRGMLLAGLVQGVLYTSAIAPFLMLAWLLSEGIDLVSIVLLILAVQAVGVVLSSIAVFWACLGPNKASRALLGSLLALGLLGLWSGSLGLWTALGIAANELGSAFTSHPQESWTVVALLVNGGLQIVILSQVFSASQLTFRADNRSTGPRLAWLLLWLNAAVAAILVLWSLPLSSRELAEVRHLGLTIAGLITLCDALVLGAFAVSEDVTLSPRQARWLRRPGWRRWSAWFLGPGAARGRVCFLGFLTLGLVLLALGWWQRPVDSGTWMKRFHIELLMGAAGVVCYGLILLTLADLLYRGWLRRGFDSPGSRRALILLVAAVLGIVPLLVQLLVGSNPVCTWLSPIGGMIELTTLGPLHVLGEAHHPWSGRGMLDARDTWHASSFLPGLITLLIVAAAALGVLLAQAVRWWPVSTARVLAGEQDRNPRNE